MLGADGSPHELEENTAVVLSSSCDSTTGTFQVLENGSLQHIPSKLCVHPAENNLDPQDDEKLVLRKECGTDHMAFFMYEEIGEIYQRNKIILLDRHAKLLVESHVLII